MNGRGRIRVPLPAGRARTNSPDTWLPAARAQGNWLPSVPRRAAHHFLTYLSLSPVRRRLFSILHTPPHRRQRSGIANPPLVLHAASCFSRRSPHHIHLHLHIHIHSSLSLSLVLSSEGPHTQRQPPSRLAGKKDTARLPTKGDFHHPLGLAAASHARGSSRSWRRRRHRSPQAYPPRSLLQLRPSPRRGRCYSCAPCPRSLRRRVHVGCHGQRQHHHQYYPSGHDWQRQRHCRQRAPGQERASQRLPADQLSCRWPASWLWLRGSRCPPPAVVHFCRPDSQPERPGTLRPVPPVPPVPPVSTSPARHWHWWFCWSLIRQRPACSGPAAEAAGHHQHEHPLPCRHGPCAAHRGPQFPAPRPGQ